MTLAEIAEGVGWEWQDRQSLMGYMYWSEAEEECRVAHRRCWKDLAEVERRYIRKEADKAPRSMGQRV
jgi:hypothetical protein